MNGDLSRRTVIATAIRAVAAAATGGLAVQRGLAASHSTSGSGAAPTHAAASKYVLAETFPREAIWNHPIGSSAVYVPAGLGRTPATHAAMPHSDPWPSGVNGAIRPGELCPGGSGPHHALGLVIASSRYLYYATAREDTFRWPAIDSDTNSVGFYGSHTNNQNAAMKMGVLLALHPTSRMPTTLRTEPGRQLAWTFQNYGGYVTDGTGDDFLITTEEGQAGSFMSQFRSDWGFAFQQRAADQTPWVKDIQDILVALYAIDNNSPTSIGGGGTPRQPLTPPLT